MVHRLFVTIVVGVLALSGSAMGEEFCRGVFLSTWNPRVYVVPLERTVVAPIQKHGFNTLFLQVRKAGDASYQSALVPVAYQQTPWDTDLLARVLDAARRSNAATPVKVHAWVDVLRVGKSTVPRGECAPAHVIDSSPEFLTRDRNGATEVYDQFWLDPGHLGVQQHLVEVVEELVRKYPVHGIYLDNFRYPSRRWGYANQALMRYQRETDTDAIPAPDDERWCQWRQHQLTKLLDKIVEVVRRYRPQAVVSVAIPTWGEVGEQGIEHTEVFQQALQDWHQWSRTQTVDWLVPTLHFQTVDPFQRTYFEGWVSAFADEVKQMPIVANLGSNLNPWRETITQWRACELAGFAGCVLFRFYEPNVEMLAPEVSLRKYGTLLFSPTGSVSQ